MSENVKRLKCSKTTLEPIDSFAIIPLTQSKVALVDASRYKALSQFSWRAVQAKHNWYAKATINRNGKDIDISMHRFVNRTPYGLVCHHINGNSLDNRESNLKNMEKTTHKYHHINNNIIKQFKPVMICQNLNSW